VGSDTELRTLPTHAHSPHPHHSVTLDRTTGASGIIVGDTSGDIATATLSSGSLSTPGTIAIADDACSTGTFNLTGQTAALATSGTGQLIVGRNGPANMNISAFATATIVGKLIVADNAASTSAVHVSGAGIIAPFPRSILNIQGLTASRIGSGGDATLHVTSGGLASFAADLIVANGSASTSTINVQGANFLNTASFLSVDGNLYLGRNLSAGTAAGAASLNVTDRGTASINGTLFIAGDTLGGTGELNISDPGSSLTCHSLETGSGATVNHTGGTFRINGGTVTLQSASTLSLVGSADVAQPATFILSNGASYTRSGLAQIGTDGAMIVRVESGSTLTIPITSLFVGVSQDDLSTVIIDGENSLIDAFGCVVGTSGPGTLTVQNAGHLEALSLDIGKFVSSNGNVNINSATATFDNSIFIGGTSSGPGGLGSLALLNGSSVNAGNVMVYAGTGSLNVTSSTLTVTDTITIGNPATFSNATINAVDLIVQAPLTASGSITANIENGTAPINANGPLIINTQGVPRFTERHRPFSECRTLRAL
jgi:T5SS/PEP-CTERM-associated repeat protein